MNRPIVELAVAVGVLAQGRHPQGLALMEAVPVEELADDMHTDETPAPMHAVHDLDLGQVGPDQRLGGGTAGGALEEDRMEVGGDVGVVLDPPSPPAAGLSDPRLGIRGEVLEVAPAAANGLGIDAQDLGDVLVAAVPQFGGLDGGIPPPIILAQGVVERPHGPFDVRGIRRHDGAPARDRDGERSPLYHRWPAGTRRLRRGPNRHVADGTRRQDAPGLPTSPGFTW